MIFLIFLFILSIIFQSSVTTIPLVLLLLLNIAVVSKKTSVFVLAFFCGLTLDIMLSNYLGETSIFYIVFLAVVFLYERKFDIQTFPFVFISSLVGSFIYLSFYDSRFLLIESFASAFISILFFWFLITADKLILRERSIFLEYES